jgi:GTP-binding protein LepA
MELSPRNEVRAGDVGYIISGIKQANEVKVGDTITDTENPCEVPIKGFEDVKPMVFAGIIQLTMRIMRSYVTPWKSCN